MDILFGWKAISDYCGVSQRTLRYWHRNRVRCPFFKTAKAKNGRVFIEKKLLLKWMKKIA